MLNSDKSKEINKKIKYMKKITDLKCGSCTGKIGSIYSSNFKLPKKEPQEFKKRIDAMSKLYKNIRKNNLDERRFIQGANFTIIYSDNHGGKDFDSSSLSKHNYYWGCSFVPVFGYDIVDMATKMFLVQKSNKIACLANHVTPMEVKDYFSNLSTNDINKLFYPNFTFIDVPGLDLVYCTFSTKAFLEESIVYNIKEALGIEWVPYCDLSLEDPPPIRNNNNLLSMSKSQLPVDYRLKGSSSNSIFKLPDGMKFGDLYAHSWERVIQVNLKSGKTASISVEDCYDSQNTFNSRPVFKTYKKFNLPEDFYIINNKNFKGSSKPKDGDIIL